MIQVFRPVVFTSNISFTIHSILTILLLFVFVPGGETGQCGWLSISLPKVSKLSLVAVGAFTITTKKKSCPSTSSPSQWVLEEKWVSVDGFLSACPKYPSLLMDLWSQPVQCHYHQQSCSGSSLQMPQMCQDPLMDEGRFPKSSEMEDRPWRAM